MLIRRTGTTYLYANISDKNIIFQLCPLQGLKILDIPLKMTRKWPLKKGMCTHT